MERSSSPSMIRDMTEGPVVSQLLRFAFPLFVSNALQAVYNLVDMVVVGNYIGATGMSAVSIGGDILHLLTFVAMGFSSAGQVIIARAVGSGRRDDIRKTIGTMFSFLLGASLAIALACYLLRFSVLRWLDTPAADFDVSLAIPYLFTGSLMLESFFGIPGLGNVSINAIHSSDMAVVRAVVVLGALLYQGVNLVTDLLYAWLDPRVRLA